MEFRQSRASGFLWFLYACTVCIVLTRTVAGMVSTLGLGVESYLILTILCIAVPVLVLYLPVRLIIGRRKVRKLHQSSWLVVILTGCLLAILAVGIRLWYLYPQRGPEEEALWTAAAQSLYQWPQLLASGQILEGSYGWLLVLAERFSSLMPGYLLLHLFLQTGAVLCAYGAACVLGGQKAGTAAGLFLLYPVFLAAECGRPNPQHLLLLTGAFLLFLAALCLRYLGKRKWTPSVFVCFAVLTGCAMVWQKTFFLILLFLLLGIRMRKEPVPRRAVWLFVGLAGAAAGLGLLLGLCWCGSGRAISFYDYIGQWDSFWWNPAWKAAPGQVSFASANELSLWEYGAWLIVLPFCLFYVFGRSERYENGGYPLILPLCLLLLVDLFRGSHMREQYFLYLLLAVFGGLGVANLLARPLIRLPEREDPLYDVPVLTELKDQEAPEENGARAASDSADHDECSRGGLPSFEEVLPGQHLPNPLPVPKRRERREMAYAFDPEDDKMCFDHPVSDTDDFDLQE